MFDHTALHRDIVFQAMDFRFSGNENVQWPQYAPQNLKTVCDILSDRRTLSCNFCQCPATYKNVAQLQDRLSGMFWAI